MRRRSRNQTDRSGVEASRRDFMKIAAAAGAMGALGASYAAASEEVSITIAGYAFERVKGLTDGRVQVQGAKHQFVLDSIGEMNTDALGGPMSREVSEIGLSPYMIAYANQGLRNHTLIPVFPLRVFRHKSIFIRPDRGIEKPEDLRGKKIATPGYSSTSLTWIRGIMQHEYGVSPHDVCWVIANKDSSVAEAGVSSKQERVLPEGLEIIQGAEGLDESELLLAGEADALFHAAEPTAFKEGDPNCVRLFKDSRKAEQAYFAKTGIFPIMHVVAVRNDVVQEHPWLPKALFEAYSKAKQLEYMHFEKTAWFQTSLPWLVQEFEETKKLMGDNYWSYGLTEKNRKALETLFQYSYEQGLASQKLTVEELFHPTTLDLREESL